MRKTRLLSWLLTLAFVLSPMHSVWAVPGEVVYDVSGKNGENDQHGTSYSGNAGTSSHDGYDGRNGGDAIVNPNGAGQAAGDIFLNLSYSAHGGEAEVQVEGRMLKPGLQGERKVRDTLKLTPDLRIQTLARGGAGGNGGNSGRGEAGGPGAPGTNAYHMGRTPVAGTDGGDGGRGGDEGDPTSGHDAGNGGKVRVRLSVRDTDLMMIAKNFDVRGNEGGKAGRKLGPGAGGAGGAGGSSDYISWTEKVGEEPIWDTEVTTNSEGEVVGSRQVQVGTRDITQSYSSTARAGNSGTSGSSGRASSKRVTDGKDSQPGSFRYIVVEEDGREQEYKGPFSLILQPGYMLQGDLNKSGFFEPGENVRVTGIKVTNNGEAPTPRDQKISIYLTDGDDWIRSKKVTLTLPVVLKPGESYTFQKEWLEFQVAEKPRKRPGVLNGKDTLEPRALVPRVERQVEAFATGATTEFSVRYPLEMEALEMLDTLAPGEFQKILLKVKNVSSQTIGRLDGTDLRRATVALQRDGGNTGPDQFMLMLDKRGEFVEPAAGFELPLEGLKPGEFMLVEAIVGVGTKAVPSTSVQITPKLRLQSPTQPQAKDLNLIQYDPTPLSIAHTFEHTAGADILLVSNSSLNDEVLDALRYTADVRGLKMNIWDFSLYGFFNMRQGLAGWKDLFSAYRNKTILILGNEVKTPVGPRRVQDLLSPDEIIEAGRRYGIRFVIVDTSENGASTVERLITPETANPERVGLDRYSSPHSYLQELVTEVGRFDDDIAGDKDERLGYDSIQVKAMSLFGPPGPEVVARQAEKLYTEARARAPEVQLFLETTHDPRHVKGRLFKTWQAGTINVRRSVDKSRTSIVSLKIPASSLKKASFVLGDDFQTTFDFSLHPDTRLRLISEILQGKFKPAEVPERFAKLKKRQPLEFAKILLSAVLADVIHEQLTVRPIGFRSALDKETIWHKLDILKLVANYDYQQTELDPESPEGLLWLDFVADLRQFNRDVVPTGQRVYSATLGWAFGHSRNVEVSQVTDELIDRLIKGVFADERIAELKKLVSTSVNERRKAGHVVQPVPEAVAKVITRSGEVAITNPIRDVEAAAAWREDNIARQQRRAEVLSGYNAASARHKLKPETCARLLKEHGQFVEGNAP